MSVPNSASGHTSVQTAGPVQAVPAPSAQAVTTRKLTVHLLLVGVLSLLLLIPKMFFDFVLSDRQYMLHEAVSSVSESWGQEQTITPPILVLRADKTVYQEKSREQVTGQRTEEESVFILPSEVRAEIAMTGEKRTRGIYTANLYKVQVTMRGHFDTQAVLTRMLQDQQNLTLRDTPAFLSFIVRDVSGIEEVTALKIDGRECTPEPLSSRDFDLYDKAFAARLSTASQLQDTLEFECSYTLRGASYLMLTALAGKADFTVTGKGVYPSYAGSFLPSVHNTTPEQFTATYNFTNLATGFAPYYVKSLPGDTQATLDVQDPTMHYVFLERMSKYALLIIAVTFVTLLVFELSAGVLLSLVQYAVCGAALLLFYLLLLSLSEFFAFLLSYAVSAAVMSLMLALYIKAALQSRSKGLLMFVLSCAIYALLYAIVSAGNYALLLGTLLLLVMLGTVMYLTRRINAAADGI